MAVAAACALVLAGCGSPVDRLVANEALRTELWEKVARNPELATQVVDRLLGSDSTRSALIDHLMANGGARQVLLTRVATDRTLMEGAVNFAVQDSSMRTHVMTLFRGIEMGAANPAPPAR